MSSSQEHSPSNITNNIDNMLGSRFNNLDDLRIPLIMPTFNNIRCHSKISLAENKLILRLPARIRDSFDNINRHNANKICCIWELPTTKESAHKMIDELGKKYVYPVFLTFTELEED